MTKMVMIVYNESMDMEVSELLASCGATSYTKLGGAHGTGTASGTHRGDDIWPGLNSILYVVCDRERAAQLMSGVRDLRIKLGHEGIKAFGMAVEEVT